MTDAESSRDAVPPRLQMRIDEDELRREFIRGPAAAMTEWASFNLHIALQLAAESGWPPEGEYRERAIGLLAIRLLHAIRATLVVLGSGYEVEGRAMVRLAFEAEARLIEVFLDPSPDSGRRWMEGKPRTRIGEVIRQSNDGVDPASIRGFYNRLSRDAHADVRGLLEVFRQPWDGLDDKKATDRVTFGPSASDDGHMLLWLCASSAALIAVIITALAKVEHPSGEALAKFLEIVRAHSPTPEELERHGLPEANMRERLNDIFREAAQAEDAVNRRQQE